MSGPRCAAMKVASGAGTRASATGIEASRVAIEGTMTGERCFDPASTSGAHRALGGARDEVPGGGPRVDDFVEQEEASRQFGGNGRLLGCHACVSGFQNAARFG